MSFLYWTTAVVVAFLPFTATAQQSHPVGPADRNTAVPDVGYVSAFENYRAMSEEKAAPYQVWRAANEEVTGQELQGNHMAMPGMGVSRPETKTDAAPSDPHADHHKLQGK